MRLIHVTCIALLAFVAVAAAQAPQEQNPVFRSGVDLVAVDVNVVDNRGRPIRDLLAPEFSVKIDGVERKVVSAQLISFQDPNGVPSSRRPDEPNFSDNVSTSKETQLGRLIVIVFDQNGMKIGNPQALVEPIRRLMGNFTGADRIAFTVVPGPGPAVEFTTDRSQILRAVARVIPEPAMFEGNHNIGLSEAMELQGGRNEVLRMQLMERQCGMFRLGTRLREECEDQVELQAATMVEEERRRTVGSMNSLKGLLRRLGEISGPKTLIYVSEGMVLRDRAGSEILEVGEIAAAARVTINVIVLDVPMFDVTQREAPPTPRDDRALNVEGLELLAGVARGGLFRSIGSSDSVFERIASEMSAYYLLGVEPLPSDRDNRRHRISVDVRRKGVTVRSRREFILAAAPKVPLTKEEMVMQVLRSPLPVTDLPMRVTTYAFQDSGSANVRVMVAAELSAPSPDTKEVGLGFVLLDQQGAEVAHYVGKMPVPPGATASRPLDYGGSVVLEPGTYTLKVGAIDESGRTGSVEHVVHAYKTSGEELATGDLMLADVTAATSGKSFYPAVLTKVNSRELVAYTEVYAKDASTYEDVKVTIEVAQDDIAAPLVTSAAELRPGSDASRRVAQGVVGLGVLPPGNYLARVVLSRSGKAVGKLTRPFEIPVGAISRADASPIIPTPSTPAAIVPVVRPTANRLEHQELVKPAMLTYVIDALSKSRPKAAPEVRSALAKARRGELKGTAREAFLGGDQFASAFLHGLELIAEGKPDQAALQFDSAMKMTPAFPAAAFYLGACLAASKRDNDAAILWSRSLPLEGQPVTPYLMLADLWIRLGNIDKAVAPLEAATKRWPGDDEIKRRLGLAYLALGQWEKTVAILDPYITAHPADQDALAAAAQGIYQVHAEGRTVGTPEQDRDRISRYAKAYAETKGPMQALVSKWAEFVNGK